MDPYFFDTSTVLNFGQRGQLQLLLTRFGRLYQLLIMPDVIGELTDPRHEPFNEVFVPAHFTIRSRQFRIPKPGANQTFAEHLTAIE